MATNQYYVMIASLVLNLVLIGLLAWSNSALHKSKEGMCLCKGGPSNLEYCVSPQKQKDRYMEGITEYSPQNKSAGWPKGPIIGNL